MTNLDAQATRNAADANLAGEAAGIRANAVGQAQVAVYRNLGNAAAGNAEVQRLAAENLEKESSAAFRAATGQVAVITPAIQANLRLAEATLQGANAAEQMKVHNDAVKLTHNTATVAEAAHAQAVIDLTLAQNSGNQALIQEAQAREHRTRVLLDDSKALTANAQAQLSANAATQNAAALGTAANNLKDQADQSRLQLRLLGLPPEQIQAQVDLLRTQQDIQNKHQDIDLSTATDEQKKAYDIQTLAEQNLLRQVAIRGQINIQLAEETRAQQRINQIFSSIGQTISQTLGQAIDDAFNDKKTEDWGTKLKSILASVMAQIAQFAFINPLIGTALQALGFGQAAQSFGSFGSLLGIGGAGAAGTAGAAGGGGGILGTVGQVASIGSSANSALGGGGSLFGEGGFGGFLDNIGSRLGFATSTSPIGGISGAPFSASIAGPSVPFELGGSGGGLFGATTLGEFAGGVGAGFGAGALLNTLVGGNKLGGTAGSGFGSLAGSAIGLPAGPPMGRSASSRRPRGSRPTTADRSARSTPNSPMQNRRSTASNSRSRRT